MTSSRVSPDDIELGERCAQDFLLNRLARQPDVLNYFRTHGVREPGAVFVILVDRGVIDQIFDDEDDAEDFDEYVSDDPEELAVEALYTLRHLA